LEKVESDSATISNAMALIAKNVVRESPAICNEAVFFS
jgi:hypothetical protein